MFGNTDTNIFILQAINERASWCRLWIGFNGFLVFINTKEILRSFEAVKAQTGAYILGVQTYYTWM